MIPPVTSRTLFFVLVATFVLASCARQEAPLRLHSLAYKQVNIEAMQQAFADESNLDIVPDAATEGMEPLDALLSDHADLTIIENSTPFHSGVRTVIPLLRSALHLLVREDLDLARKEAMGESVTVFVANNSHAGRTFVELAVARTGLLFDRVEMVDTLQPGETDALVYVGPINPNRTPWYLPGYRLASLAEADPATAEFLREGISLLVPQLQAMTIPARTYTLPGNERPLQSLAVETLLVARRDASEEQIYQLTRVLIEQKAHFAALEPDVFSWVTEHFDKEQLSFPLHAGARRYLERDEPSLLERYAESVNLLVYLFILLLTGVVAAMRWRAQRKKDRVDTFYARVLTLRRQDNQPATDRLRTLDDLEEEAYRLLIAEKLAADESFRIFADLVKTTREELKSAD